MSRSKHRLPVILAAAVLAPVATAAAANVAGGDRGPRHPAVVAAVGDREPRNAAAEAATGDIEAMRAVVQDVVDCLREKGFHPGDPEVRGDSVLIGDWNPGWDSPAHRATHDCFF